MQAEVNKEVATYFKEGKRIEEEAKSKKIIKKQKKTKNDDLSDAEPKSLFSSIFSSLTNSSSHRTQENQDFDPSSPIIKFESISEANDFKGKIENSIRNVLYKGEKNLKSCIQLGINDFSKELDRQRTDSLEKIKNSAQGNIEDFDIEIKLPDARSIDLDISVHSILEDAVEEKTKIVNRSRRKSGAWGTVCSWFNTDDWGWEDYQTTEEYFQVDLHKIAASSDEGVKILFHSANFVLDNEIYPKLQQGVENFFGVFREKIEHIRGDLMSGIQKHSLDQEKKSEILEYSTKMAREASALEKDCTALNDSAEELRRKEGVFVVKGEVVA